MRAAGHLVLAQPFRIQRAQQAENVEVLAGIEDVVDDPLKIEAKQQKSIMI